MKTEESRPGATDSRHSLSPFVHLPAGFTLLLGMIGCAVSLVAQPVAAVTPTVDAPATIAAATFAAELSETPTSIAKPPVKATPAPATPTPNQAATQTAKAVKIATDVAAALTAQPTATPNLAATQTRQTALMQTAVAATLAALPTATTQPTPTRKPTLEPKPTPTLTRVPETVVLPMVAIPAGDFVMGSSDEDLQLTLDECNQTEGNCQADWFAGEQPARSVFVDQFSISKYEVTNAQYNICVANQVCPPIGRLPADADIPYKAGFFAGSAPAVAISWDNANLFCQWIGARLPSEEEWEKAARGTDGTRRYPWGRTFVTGRANLASGGPQVIGSYPGGISPYGVMDMAGNVFEWTATATGDGRYMVRGGGWSKFYFRGRVMDRGTKLPPEFANYDIGFRCAR